MTAWWPLLLVVTPLFVIVAVLRNQKRLRRLRTATVELHVDEFGVRRVMADGREEGVDWTDVTKIEVLLTETGPYGHCGGVVIVAGDELHGCLVPLDELQSSGLVEALTRLPGFDSRRLIESITPKQAEVSWRRAIPSGALPQIVWSRFD